MLTRSYCQRLPKIELHAHLNGSISLKTIKKLHSLSGSKESIFSTNEGYSSESLTLKQPTTMEEVFKVFPLIQSLTTSRSSLITATKDVIEEFANDGVVYLELRSTPKSTNEMSKMDYVEVVIEGIIEASKDNDIVTRLLLSIDRRQTTEDAQQTVSMAAADKSGLIVGVELSGDPSIDGRKFIPALQQARASGLKVSIHLAEVSNQMSEVEEFLTFLPDRIGHGTFLHTDENYVNWVIQHRIPLDDKGLMDCDLSEEFWKASQAFDLTTNDLWQISMDALEMSFLEKSSDEYKKLADLLKRRQLLGSE